MIELVSSGKRFIIRPYRPGDEGRILSSWRLAFGREMSPEEWRWKYQEAPLAPEILLCLDGEEVVVHYAGQGLEALSPMGAFSGLHLADSFSHPGYRWAVGGKRGLFARTAAIFWRTYFRGCPFPEPVLEPPRPRDFFWGLPGERHFRLGRLVLDYRALPEGVLFARKVAEGPGFGPGALRMRELRPPFSPEDLTALRGLFSRDFLRKMAFFPRRTEGFLSWRYRRPGSSYGVVVMRGLFGGFKAAVFYAETKEGRVVMDLAAESPRALSRLLSALPPGDWRLWLPGWVPRGPLRAGGFREEEEPLGICPSFLSYLPQCQALGSRFLWTMADADLF